MGELNCKVFRDKWKKDNWEIYVYMGKGIFKRIKNE